MKKYSNIFLSIAAFFLSAAFVSAAVGYPSAAESVELELSVRNCNFNGICEPLLGETTSCELDCEPPPEPATTSPRRSSSGNVPFASSSNVTTSLDGIWQMNQPYANAVYIHLQNITTETFDIEWIFINPAYNYFKLVKSPFRYPVNVEDGRVVYEGSGRGVSGENVKELYFYALFQRFGETLYIPRIYFTTPSAPRRFEVPDNLARVETPSAIPQTSQPIHVGEVSLEQKNIPISISANRAEVKYEEPIDVFINTDIGSDSLYNFTGKLNPVLSTDETIFQFERSGADQKIQIPPLKIVGDYVLTISAMTKDGERYGESNILLHYEPPQKKISQENFCNQKNAIARFLCVTAIGNQMYFLSQNIIKLW